MAACQAEFFRLHHPVEDRMHTFGAVQLSDLEIVAGTCVIPRDRVDPKGAHPFLLDLRYLWYH